MQDFSLFVCRNKKRPEQALRECLGETLVPTLFMMTWNESGFVRRVDELRNNNIRRFPLGD